MRIRIIRTPSRDCIDGVQLSRFVPGTQHEVGNSLGALFLAEGWAEPAPPDEESVTIPRASHPFDDRDPAG
jgi:hypothetical protein